MMGDYSSDFWLGFEEGQKKAADKRIEQLEAVLIRLYNSGYRAGHEDTVEGVYTDVLPVDMDTYHDDIVAEWLSETLQTED